MAQGQPITGVNGTFLWDVSGGSPTNVAHVRNFVINERADNQVFADSSGGGAKDCAEGIRSWDGTITIYLDGGDPRNTAQKLNTIRPGTLADVEFHWDSGETGTGLLTGTCRVNRIGDLEADIEGSGMIGATVDVIGHGALTPGTET